MSSRESIFFFSDTAAPLHHYHIMTVIHQKNILFRSIVFRIKKFLHVDITPSVPHPLDPP